MASVLVRCGLLTSRLENMNARLVYFAGCLINATDRLGNTALHVAARYGHELLISTLLDKGADPMQYAGFCSLSYLFGLASLMHCFLVFTVKQCTKET